MLKSALKRFGFIKPSSGLYDGEKCCLNNDGCFFFVFFLNNGRRVSTYRGRLITVQSAFCFLKTIT